MEAKEYLNQFKTNNEDGIISYDSIIELMESYHRYKLELFCRDNIIGSCSEFVEDYDEKHNETYCLKCGKCI